jgi:hypothetical protein
MSLAVSPTDSAPTWPRRRPFNGFGLVVAVLVHLLILAAVLTWRSPAPPPKPRSIDLSIVQPKEQPRPPEPPPLAPKPEFQPPSLPAIPEPPPIAVMETPQPARVAPPVVAPAPAGPVPGPAGPPATAGPAAAAPPAPAGSAVGSTRLAEDCADATDRMMVAQVYKLSSRTTSVKEMDRRKPVGTLCLAQLDIAPRHMGLGLPGMDFSEWYGLDIRFTINMPQDAERDFVLLCDDGGVLYVDDKEVVNADGLHGTDAVMGTVHLTKGIHHVRVRYFQGPGDGALMLGWKKAGAPTSETRPIPRRLMGRPQAGAASA